MKLELTADEIELLLEALNRAASRHESYSRFNPRAAGPHDKKAAAMRKLRQRLNRTRLLEVGD